MTDKVLLGLTGLATDVQSVSQLLRFKLNMYRLKEVRGRICSMSMLMNMPNFSAFGQERDMKVQTFTHLLSSTLYEKRFGPWFTEPVIAGLTEDNKPFISGMDLIGER
jgi:20S proteasome subunit beta 3